MVANLSAAADPDPFPAITTRRLVLRCVRESDAESLAALMTAEISLRLASWAAEMTPRMALDRIRGAREAAWDGRSMPLVLEARHDGVLMGWFAASRAPGEAPLMLLTYWLGEAFHGQGLMREAAPAALALALDLLGPCRVRAAVQADNEASLSVVRQLAMRPLGPGRIWCAARGREEDCLWFDLACGDAAESAAAE